MLLYPGLHILHSKNDSGFFQDLIFWWFFCSLYAFTDIEQLPSGRCFRVGFSFMMMLVVSSCGVWICSIGDH